MEKNQDQSQKSLTNLVFLAFGGYIAIAGLVGGALFMRNGNGDITASTPPKVHQREAVQNGNQEKEPSATKTSGQAATESKYSLQHSTLVSDQTGLPQKDATSNYKPRFDAKILEAARNRAAEKIGDLRGSVKEVGSKALSPVIRKKPEPRVQQPSRVKPRDKVRKKIRRKPIYIQRPAWQPDDDAGEVLPPIVDNDIKMGIDPVMTGSIK